jgi:hypothetical protein
MIYGEEKVWNRERRRKAYGTEKNLGLGKS